MSKSEHHFSLPGLFGLLCVWLGMYLLTKHYLVVELSEFESLTWDSLALMLWQSMEWFASNPSYHVGLIAATALDMTRFGWLSLLDYTFLVCGIIVTCLGVCEYAAQQKGKGPRHE